MHARASENPRLYSESAAAYGHSPTFLLVVGEAPRRMKIKHARARAAAHQHPGISMANCRPRRAEYAWRRRYIRAFIHTRVYVRTYSPVHVRICTRGYKTYIKKAEGLVAQKARSHRDGYSTYIRQSVAMRAECALSAQRRIFSLPQYRCTAVHRHCGIYGRGGNEPERAFVCRFRVRVSKGEGGIMYRSHTRGSRRA